MTNPVAGGCPGAMRDNQSAFDLVRGLDLSRMGQPATKSKRGQPFSIACFTKTVASGCQNSAICLKFVSARKKAQATTCINNLRIIDGAKEMWALEAKKNSSDTPTGAGLQSYIGRKSSGQLPTCPNDSANSFATSYSVNEVDAQTTCNIGGANANYPHKLE